MEGKEIRKRAYGHLQSGLHCAEVVAKTILEIFSKGSHPELIRVSSGFGGGIAGSTEELCGAFTGGVLVLSYLLGRETPGDDIRDCAALINAFKTKFLDEFDSLNCQAFLTAFREEQDQAGCAKLTAHAAVMVAELLEEFGRETEMDLDTYSFLPREKVALGQCPFTGSCLRPEGAAFSSGFAR